MSKPNLLYYFRTKEAMHRALIERVLDSCSIPCASSIRRGNPKRRSAAIFAASWKWRATSPRKAVSSPMRCCRGAAHRGPVERAPENAGGRKGGGHPRLDQAGKIAKCDPYHLIFAIWATTQHYADFDVQVQAVLGPPRSGEGASTMPPVPRTDLHPWSFLGSVPKPWTGFGAQSSVTRFRAHVLLKPSSVGPARRGRRRSGVRDPRPFSMIRVSSVAERPRMAMS